jgi:hypothetical protein
MSNMVDDFKSRGLEQTLIVTANYVYDGGEDEDVQGDSFQVCSMPLRHALDNQGKSLLSAMQDSILQSKMCWDMQINPPYLSITFSAGDVQCSTAVDHLQDVAREQSFECSRLRARIETYGLHSNGQGSNLVVILKGALLIGKQDVLKPSDLEFSRV